MKPIRSALCIAAGIGLVLAQPALAVGTRSGDSIPSASIEGGSQKSAFIHDGGASEFPLWWIIFGIALLGGLAVILSHGNNNNDSPG